MKTHVLRICGPGIMLLATLASAQQAKQPKPEKDEWEVATYPFPAAKGASEAGQAPKTGETSEAGEATSPDEKEPSGITEDIHDAALEWLERAEKQVPQLATVAETAKALEKDKAGKAKTSMSEKGAN